MGLADRLKSAVAKVAELAVNTPEQSIADQHLAAPGDAPTAAALADAAAQVPAVASASFPDDEGAQWSVERTWASDGYAIASATPSVDVGYARIAFAFRCEGDQAFPVGSYAWTDDGWVLLSSAGHMPSTLSQP